MTLTLDLSAELETQLEEAAARHGQDVATFARAVLAEAAAHSTEVNGHADSERPSLEEFEAAMDELSAGSEHHPQLSAEDFSRANIYRDHD